MPPKANAAELEPLGFDGLPLIAVSGAAVSLLPLSVMLALAGGFLLVTVRVAVSLAPVPLYLTVTLHDLLGPMLVATQPSAVFVNAAGPDSATVSTPVAEPPEFVTRNVREALCPTATVP